MESFSATSHLMFTDKALLAQVSRNLFFWTPHFGKLHFLNGPWCCDYDFSSLLVHFSLSSKERAPMPTFSLKWKGSLVSFRL